MRRTVHLLGVLLGLAFSQGPVFAALFQNPDIRVDLSPALLDHEAQRAARKDSLLPAFQGDAVLRDLLRRVPDLWTLETLGDDLELATPLQVRIVFVEGSREEQYCRILSAADTLDRLPAVVAGAGVVAETGTGAGTAAGYSGGDTPKAGAILPAWSLEMGLDFISGASNTVEVHVRMCLELAREQLPLLVRHRDGRQEVLPPRKVEKQLEEYRVNAAIDPEFQRQVLRISKEVLRTATCPRDIRDYLVLLDLYRQVDSTRTDLYQLEQELNPLRNGGHTVTSCAYSREYNRKYTENWNLACDVDSERCRIAQSVDGTKEWRYDTELDRLWFRGRRLLFFGWGDQGIRDGGHILDLKLIPLSKNLYLEAYLDADGTALALGLLTLSE